MFNSYVYNKLIINLVISKKIDKIKIIAYRHYNKQFCICNLKLGIRHPEELSFAKPLETEDLRHNYREREAAVAAKKKSQSGPNSADTNTFIGHQTANNSTHSSNNSLDKGTSGCTPVLPQTSRSPATNSYTTPISSPVSTVRLVLSFIYDSISLDDRCNLCNAGYIVTVCFFFPEGVISISHPSLPFYEF